MNDLVRTLRALDQRLEQTNAGEVPGNLTAGSVVFVSATKSFTQDNANLFWDDTNNRLGVGTNAPSYKLDVSGDMRATKIYPGAGTTYYLDDTASGLSTNGSWASGNTAISGSSSPYLSLQTTSATNKRTSISFYQSATALYQIGVDLSVNNTQDFFLYDGAASATILVVNTSGELLPGGAGTQNLGNASNYWADVSYKTLTDRGCVPLQEEWEMPGGQKMTNLEVLAALRPHPTDKTIHGATKLDYASVPTLAQRPAPIATEDVYKDVVIEEADPKRGKDRVTEKRLKWRKGEKMGADGIEMTLLFGVIMGALVEINERLTRLED